jgi:site-specific recombinase XerD
MADVLEQGSEVDPELLERLRADSHAAASGYAPNTLRGRRADLTQWVRWCVTRHYTPLPAQPEIVAEFIHAMRAAPYAKRPATIRRYLDTISYVHRVSGVIDPRPTRPVQLALRALRRAGTRSRQAAPITETHIQQILSMLHDTPRDRRDRALLLTTADLLGRCGEVVALQFEHLVSDTAGHGLLLVTRFKTTGDPTLKALRGRTLRAIRTYVDTAGIHDGPLFRSLMRNGRVRDRALHPNEVGRILRRLVERAGLPTDGISGHSLRVGMSQELVAKGATLLQVMSAGDWKSPEMPVRYAERLAAERGAVVTLLDDEE